LHCLGRVNIQRCHLSREGRRSNVFLTFYFSSVVLVSLLVGWGGILVCWGFCQFFHWWPHLRRGCWGLYGVCDLWHTREHLLWFWGFLIVISVWLFRNLGNIHIMHKMCLSGFFFMHEVRVNTNSQICLRNLKVKSI
jgi:hypothetical protein